MPWTKSRGAAKGGDEPTIIAENAEFDGQLSLRGPLLVHGKIRGEVTSDSSVVVAGKGSVNANISAVAVHISGEVVGDVVASERVELHDKCHVYGDVTAPIVVIAEGALFEGQCRMIKDRPADTGVSARDLSVVPLKQRSETPR